MLISPYLSGLRIFLERNGLADLGFSGPNFTWSNNRQGLGNIREHLDRVKTINGPFSSQVQNYSISQYIPLITLLFFYSLIVTSTLVTLSSLTCSGQEMLLVHCCSESLGYSLYWFTIHYLLTKTQRSQEGTQNLELKFLWEHSN